MTVKDRDLNNRSETVNLLVNSCVANAHSVIGLQQKKVVNPNYCHNYIEIKYVKDCNSNSTFIALNLYLMIDSKTQKAKIRDRNR